MHRYLPMIDGYHIEGRFLMGDFLLQNNPSVIYQVARKLSSSSPETMKLSSFGPLGSMCGTVDIPVDRMGHLHAQYRTLFLNHPLVGSHVIRLPALDYLHFVLDVDFKRAAQRPAFFRKLSTAEYRQYVSNPDKDSSGNHLVYALVHFLVKTLHLPHPIYILGKEGTLARGFHLEIPDLVLPYYDHALLTDACRSVLPEYVDAISTYSIFGSQKYNNCIIVQGQKYREFDFAYLPYAAFAPDGQFYDATKGSEFDATKGGEFVFRSLGAAFDALNLFREVNYGHVKSFSTFVCDETRLVHGLLNRLESDEEDRAAEEILPTTTRTDDDVKRVGIIRDGDNNCHVIYKSLSLLPEGCNDDQRIPIHRMQPIRLVWIHDIRDLVHVASVAPEEENNTLGSTYLSPERAARKFTFPPLPPDCVVGAIDMTEYRELPSSFLERLAPFTLDHVRRLTVQNPRHHHTVCFLLAHMFLTCDGEDARKDYARVLASSPFRDDRVLFNMIRVLRHCGVGRENNINPLWYDQCLLNLLVTCDVVGVIEAYRLLFGAGVTIPALLREEENTGDFVVPSPVGRGGVRIPRILFVACAYDALLAIRLLATYRPILGGSSVMTNGLVVWDNIRRRWMTQNAKTNMAVMLPDLDFLAERTRQLQLARAEREEKPKPPSPKSVILTSLATRIRQYWATGHYLQRREVPGYLIGIGDVEGYVVLEGHHSLRVYDIHPLMIYDAPACSPLSAVREYRWTKVEQLLRHLPDCPFFARFLELVKDMLTCEAQSLADERERREERERTLTVRRRAEDQRTNVLGPREATYYEVHAGGAEGIFTVPFDAAVGGEYAERRRLASMTRDQYHVDLGNRQWKYKAVRTVAAYVKYYVDGDVDGARRPECDCAMTHTLLILSQIFSYDVSALRFFIRYVMRACTRRSDKRVHIFVGNSNSGKTFLLNLLSSALGDVIGLLSGVTAHQGVGDRTHDLYKGGRYTRLWYLDEIDGNRKVNSLVVKQITGRSPLWIRGNYQDGSTQCLEAALMLFGNAPPQFDWHCPALTQRLRYLTFRSQFRTDTSAVCLRRCVFPQCPSLMTDAERRRPLTVGLLALCLHAGGCQAFPTSSFVVTNEEEEDYLPVAVKEANLMYSPETALVKTLFDRMGFVHNLHSYVTTKRVSDLLSSHPEFLKDLNISAHDARVFIETLYPTTQVPTKTLKVPVNHINVEEEETWIIHGVREIDREANDSRKRKRFSSSSLYEWVPPPANSY